MAYRKMTCPECSKVLRPAKPVPAGKKVRCPECESVFYPEDAINPVEADEDGARPAGRRPEPAKKAGKKEEAKPKEQEETYGTLKDEDETEEAEEEKKRQINYSLDTSVKDLRGPAQAMVMSPSNKLTLAGFVGFGGWLVLLVFLMIPALFPLKPDEKKKRPVQHIKPGLSHISPTGPASAGGGGGGGFVPAPSGGEKKAIPKEAQDSNKPGFFDVAGYDVAFVADLAWYWFLVSLIPILFCMCWSAAVSFGAIQMQNLESRGWGIAASILAMIPINVGGLQIVTAMVIQVLLIQVIDDLAFIGYVITVFTGIEWLMSVGAGVWALLTLMNQDVIDGFEYVAE